MLLQSRDCQIHLLAMDDRPISRDLTKLPVDAVIQQYYILIRRYSMAPW